MTFNVRFTHRARLDVHEFATYLKDRSPKSAQKWLRELKVLQENLAVFPSRFAVMPNEKLTSHLYRSAMHYSHKVIFNIDEQNKIVYIVRVYHGARKPFESEEDIES